MRYRRKKHVTLLKEGRFHRFEYAEIDHCCQNFNRVDEWLDAEKLQHHGPVGHASARLMRSRDVVKIVTEQIRLNETVFLHRQALIQNVTRPGLFTREILPHDRSQPAASSAATGRLERSFSGIDAKETRRAKVVSPKLAAKSCALPPSRKTTPSTLGWRSRGSSSGES